MTILSDRVVPSESAPAGHPPSSKRGIGSAIISWVTSTDHKVIGLQYGFTSLFFLLVGLEIKREMLDGQLSTWPRRILPGIAAAGGMIVPALVYLALNVGPTAEGFIPQPEIDRLAGEISLRRRDHLGDLGRRIGAGGIG